MNTEKAQILILPSKARRELARWEAWFVRTMYTFSAQDRHAMYRRLGAQANPAVRSSFKGLHERAVDRVAPEARERTVEVAGWLARHNPVCPPPGPLEAFRALLGLPESVVNPRV